MIKNTFIIFSSRIVAILFSLLLNKYIAIKLGPEGIGLFGQLKSLIAIATNYSNGGISSATIRLFSRYKNNLRMKQLLFNNLISYSVLFIVPLTILFLIFSKHISIYLFGSENYITAINFFAVSFVFYSIVINFQSIINGQSRFILLSILIILQSLVNLTVGVVFISLYNEHGLMLFLFISQSFLAISIILYAMKYKNFTSKIGVKTNLFKLFFQYTIMSSSTAIILPTTLILLRMMIQKDLGTDYMGYWQASWQLSEVFIGIIISTLASYYIPKLSQHKNYHNYLNELKKTILFSMLIVIPAVIFIYFLRDYIIELLYSEQFLVISDFVAVQLIGDILKVLFIVLNATMTIFALTKYYIFVELFHAVFFLSLSWFLLDYYGFMGLAYAYILSYLISISLQYILVYRKLDLIFLKGKIQ